MTTLGDGFRGFMAAFPHAPFQGVGKRIQKYLYALGFGADLLFDWTYEGMQQRFPNLADDTALPFMGRDRVILRGINESTSTYRQRLRKWLDIWVTAGSAFSIIRVLNDYLAGNVLKVATVAAISGTWYVRTAAGVESVYPNRGNWNWQNEPVTQWSRFWVIIWVDPAGPWAVDGAWGSGGQWGDGGGWGSNILIDVGNSVRQIVGILKPAGVTDVEIIWAFDPNSFNPLAAPGSPLPDGHWEAFGKITTPGSNSLVIPSRLDTARYEDGTAPLVLTES